MEIDGIIVQSLRRLLADIRKRNWYGRKNEVINLYVFSHLLPFVKDGTALHHPAQIGIEVAVPQVAKSKKSKAQVRKDLVIWRETGENCWDELRKPNNTPLAILEWKVLRDKEPKGNDKKDLEWLKSFTRKYRVTLGYAVTIGLIKNRSILVYSMVKEGTVIWTENISIS